MVRRDHTHTHTHTLDPRGVLELLLSVPIPDCYISSTELVAFESTIPDITPTDDPILLPVSALRFTHHTVNANFAFGDDHNNSQESIFKLFLIFF